MNGTMTPSKPRATRVLGLFAKRPVPGEVKTRLAAETSPEFAARVAEALLRDSLKRFSVFPAKRVLAFSPADAEEWFTDLAGTKFTLTPQADGDLGQRMQAFFTQQLEAGATAVVLVGADSPTQPLVNIAKAFHWLSGSAEVVLGPATDGGYYLVGSGQKLPPIFEGVTWGGDRVLTETVARLSDPSWRLAILPPWYDVDTLADWHVLQGHLAAVRKMGGEPGMPHIEALFKEEGDRGVAAP